MRTWFALVVAACHPPAAAPIVSQAEPIAVPLTAASGLIGPIVERRELTPPWTLTASDGSGLQLTRVHAKAVMEGPLAFTELHVFFRNTEDRQREGRFQITLPPRAAISRFAMENAGTWMEAEVVPKLAARRAYEDFLHRRQDPALLEKAAGNQFTARVFPIPARGEKHLVVSYSQELPGMRYTLPLRGLPRAERIDVELAIAGRVERLAERDWQADRDFIASTPAAPAVAADTLVAAQVELVASTTRDPVKSITLLVDTSASRALGYESYVASTKRLVDDLRATWGDALPLQVVAFDQDTQLIFEGRADAFRDQHVRKLVERGAAGASDLGQAIAQLARMGPKQRVVLVGDGVVTAGLEGKALQATVKQLRGVERIDVVLTGGLRDDRAARLLVRSGLARAGAVLDLDDTQVGAAHSGGAPAGGRTPSGGGVASALGESVATDIAIAVPGASWVYPRSIPSARAGTHVMVYARLAKPATSDCGGCATATRPPAITVVANGVTRDVPLTAGTAPLVERAIAGAELDELEAQLPNAKDATALRAKIASTSVRARVLSSETSMLVLESEADYPRYRIDRKALADVLVVGTHGVERVRRADLAPIPTNVPTPDRTEVVHRPAPRDATPDNDRDGILDADDRCPLEPEATNGFEDDDGCPDRGRVIMTSAQIVILSPVHFEIDKAIIRRESFSIIDMVAEALIGNPDIELVEIGGHTDERGDDVRNTRISQRRAEAVRDYLIAKGVDAKRLVATGYGETRPIDPAHNERAWAKNRRVDFLILKRADNAWGVPTRTLPPQRIELQSRKPAVAAPPPPVTGELATIQDALAKRDVTTALTRARDWHAREPGDVLALVGLGEALDARGAHATAARVYGSIIDLFPGRADMRRFAGERLSRLPNARALVVDTFRRAVADRPDHLTGHRLLAYALVRADRSAEAFDAILDGLGRRDYRNGSFAGGLRVLGEDAAMIGAVYANAFPAKRAAIQRSLAMHELAIASKPSTRFVLSWETDANDVDFHIEDARGGHAYFENMKLPSGGELYADVTTGYGPECFAIDGTPKAGPYKLSLEYYAQGPMGYGMGVVQIVAFDPAKGFAFDDRPFVIMQPRAKVDLGMY